MAKKGNAKRRSPPPRQTLGHLLSAGQLYVLACAVLVLYSASAFYGSLRLQTEHVHLWFKPESLADFISGARTATWSAPLDDVFIHFDFARSIATGAPFEWTPGGGYSSGGTSILYPFALALGYLAGFRELDLMHWAALVAVVSTFGLLLSVRRMFQRLPAGLALLAPLLLLSTGVLNWTLWSGMELALFLAIFGLCLTLWDDLLARIERGLARAPEALPLGLSCALLVASRPEAAPIVALFATWPAMAVWKRGDRRSAALGLLLIGAPGALVVCGHMLANHQLTGTASAAGALAKLELHHPYMTKWQVFAAWKEFVLYQVLRLSDYHFSAVPGVGYIVWLLALLSLVFEKTRRYGILLWLCIVFWVALVALNGQVRWQNERYAMPAVAWLLLAAALGVAAALEHAWTRSQSWTRRFTLAAPVGAAVLAFACAQAPRHREQLWFFGRASRNILEQHVQAGHYLGFQRRPRPHRILLSDAGALPYAAQLPAYDLIGLGGFRGLPLAEAGRQGVGAAVELLEHVPADARPDIMALYPSWWGNFVLWFGRREAAFPVRGNVICGGVSKVIYKPDWSPLEDSDRPFSLGPGESLQDTVDLADLVSERAHRVSWDREAQGFVDMKLLPHPRDSHRDLWDAGRVLSPGMGLTFTLTQPAAELLVRIAPAQPASFTFESAGAAADGPIEVKPADHWQEVRAQLAAHAFGPVTLRVLSGELIVYHLFAVDPPGDARGR